MSENTPDPAEVTESTEVIEETIEIDDPDAAALDDTGAGDEMAGEEVDDEDLDDDEAEDTEETTGA